MASKNIMPGRSAESEKTLERKLSQEIKALGGWSLKLLAQHISGLPDRLCLLPGGVMFFVEVKSTGQKPRKIQLHVQNKLRELGFEVFVIDNTPDLKKLIRSYESR